MTRSPPAVPEARQGSTNGKIAPDIRSVDSRELFGEAKTLVIEHCGQRYLLRITRENKLILTK